MCHAAPVTILARQVTVPTTANGILLTDGTALKAGDSYELLIKNTDTANTVYLDGSTAVASGTGFPVGPGEVVTVPLAASEVLYGRATGANCDVRVLQSRTV